MEGLQIDRRNLWFDEYFLEIPAGLGQAGTKWTRQRVRIYLLEYNFSTSFKSLSLYAAELKLSH